MKAVVQRRVARSEGVSPLRCLNQSRTAFSKMVRPGDRIGGLRVTDRLVDLDGSIVLVMEDGSYYEPGA